MANRLTTLERGIIAPHADEDGGRPTQERAARDRAVAPRGVAPRAVHYRVPGTLPALAEPSPLNAWAASLTMLLSWREGRALTPAEALERLGASYVDLYRRHAGLPASEKTALLTAAGAIAEPPVHYGALGWEALLREHGPLWVTDDERGAHLFSLRSRVVVGIEGTGRDSTTRLEVIDPSRGRASRVKLREFAQRMGQGNGGRPRVQVVHLTPGGAAPAPGAPATAQGLLSRAHIAPAVVGAGAAVAGLTYNILRDAILNPTPDITFQLTRMEGKKHPGDDPAWDARGQWRGGKVPVFAGATIGTISRDEQWAKFEVHFSYNGHSVGAISVRPTDTNDAFGWKLNVTQDVRIRDDLATAAPDAVAAVEVIFVYRHTAPIVAEQFYNASLILYGNGTIDHSGSWKEDPTVQALAARGGPRVESFPRRFRQVSRLPAAVPGWAAGLGARAFTDAAPAVSPGDPGTAPPGSPATGVGVSKFLVYNCHVDKHEIKLWSRDIDAGGQWVELATIPHQYNDAGTCPGPDAVATEVPLQDGHRYELVAVDPQGIACGENAPDKLGCQKLKWWGVGNASGPAVPVTVA